MIKIYEGDELKWTITDVGSVNDIVILGKDMASNCSMTYDGFEKIYYANVSASRTNTEAYEKAEQFHIQYFGKRKYSNYNSFRVIRDRKIHDRPHS